MPLEDYLDPEARARIEIDKQVTACGWVVQDYQKINPGAGPGVAVREFVMAPGHGAADYLLFVNKAAAGVIEAKKAGSYVDRRRVAIGKARAPLNVVSSMGEP